MLISILSMAGTVTGQQRRRSPRNPSPETLTARQIAQRALPSVVVLVTETANGKSIALGSGFFVQDGVIATNYHVIKSASRISASIVGQKSSYEIVGTVGVDAAKDLVLLKVEGVRAKPLPLAGGYAIEVGDEIYVVGNPEGLEGTFSQGIISALRGTDYIQITAPISHGSSGGPVFNKNGEVIGVAVGAIEGGQNLNFAIPISGLLSLLSFRRPVRPLNELPVESQTIPQSEQLELQQTVAWIKEKVEAYSLPRDYNSALQSDGCSLTVRHNWITLRKKLPAWGQAKILLSDLDPNRIGVEQALLDIGSSSWSVELRALNDKEVVELTGNDPEYSFPLAAIRWSGRYVISFDDKEMAFRVSKAFQHAIKLCGGKTEPF